MMVLDPPAGSASDGAAGTDGVVQVDDPLLTTRVSPRHPLIAVVTKTLFNAGAARIGVPMAPHRDTPAHAHAARAPVCVPVLAEVAVLKIDPRRRPLLLHAA